MYCGRYSSAHCFCSHSVVHERGEYSIKILETSRKIANGWDQTLPSAVADRKIRNSEDTPSTSTLDEDSNDAEHEEPTTFRSLITRRVVIAMANYSVTVFMESASSAIQPLLYASPIAYGGLGLSSFQIGLIMCASGIVIGVSSVLLFPPLSHKLGLTTLYRICFASHLFIQVSYAMMNVLARRSGRVDGAVLGFLAVQLIVYNFTIMTFSKLSGLSLGFPCIDYFITDCMFMHINDAAPSRRALGTINGLAQTVGTTVRIFAPIAASSLFSLSQQHHLLGGTMVYCVLAGFIAFGLVVSMWLPRRLKSEEA